MSPIIITSGEPAGIGPDLCVALPQAMAAARASGRALPPLTVLADIDLLRQRAKELGLPFDPVECGGDPAACQAELTATQLCVWHQSARVPSVAGEINPANADYVLAMLDHAVAAVVAGRFAAMVTAPVHKGVINAAGVPFSGHTEYLAAKLGVDQVVMMLLGAGHHGPLRVALATTHLPLAKVPAAIQTATLTQTIRIIMSDLQARFGMKEPRLLVAGLNPHAGEQGYLGREEIEVITPVLDTLRRQGMQLMGPLPADTLFTPPVLSQGDAALAMYHDQGLAVLKYATFGQGVNITLGLPIIRTSVDHGVALGLAGRGGADIGSLLSAINYAAKIAQRSSASTDTTQRPMRT